MRPTPLPRSSRPSHRQHRDDFDNKSQLTPIAPLECFVTAESNLECSHDQIEQPNSIMRFHPHKQNVYSTVSATNVRTRSRQSQPTTPSSQSVEQDLSRPSTPVFSRSCCPGSINSIPSSPGDMSSITLSEDPQSLSASFSELPPSQSPAFTNSPDPAKGLIPQLVMPTLIVPQRRPFSETGLSLGKLKVLVTGQTGQLQSHIFELPERQLISGPGIGKTSLIPAIAQASVDIVHMDRVNAAPNNTPSSTYASTRPRPRWRTDARHDASLRQRSSVPDDVLDRNICFVDCPAPSSDNTTLAPAVEYVESQLAQLCHKTIDYLDLSTLLSSGTEPNVDVVLYMLPSTGPSHNDLKCMRGLQGATNIIPLLAQADALSNDEVISAKDRISQDLKAADIDFFSFTKSEPVPEFPHIYAVSSAAQQDYEVINASILMSSDYLPPLASTDLGHLVAEILSVDGSAWLRHAAASKAINWIQQQRCQRTLPHSVLTCKQPYSHSQVTPVHLIRCSVHRSQWSRPEMSSWAEALRQSLAIERFNLSRQHVLLDVPTVQMPLIRTKYRRSRFRSHHRSASVSISSHQDPLGLLEFVNRLQTSGKLTLELLSSFGALSCLAALIIQPELVHP
ncbi:hypothetical protein QQS21_001070 [Conoideocrella luteorostrata]|uniref:Septin-type G domain-containing protein n=1 Tax=Conoideocrella luteorostrata TaxID=1105319 RepID=A0AAJ0G2C9_9HYPO|nr:hypothetical protein QQS21_001070 [Conoideocrella luteorostrata]